MNHLFMVKWGAFFAFILFLFGYFDLESTENQNWNRKWNLMYHWSPFEELTTGGQEGGDPKKA